MDNSNNKEMKTDESSDEDMDVTDEGTDHVDSSDHEEMSDPEEDSGARKVYLPGDPIQKGEVLTCDKSAYVMLHQAQTGSPCLSFDIIQNPFSQTLNSFPMTAYIVAGTQSDEAVANSVIVMKMGNLHVTQENESDDDDDDEESSDDEDYKGNKKIPILSCDLTRHSGCVNRIRSLVHENTVFAASWSEFGRVNIWDITAPLKGLDNPTKKEEKISRPVFSFVGHQAEGYGLDWSSTKIGMLASGDCKSGLHIWYPAEGAWQVDQCPLVGHSQSVEDIQWSPNEENVLATCSVDKSIRIWDIRSSSTKANKLTVENAHEMDVNVISWNRNEPFVVSGGDDGVIHIWDLRQFKTGTSVATFKHHTAPITTVEWHPEDGSVFASGGADNQIALWDIAVERDTEDSEDIEDLPSQLLFIHQGQTDIKELHWHPKYTGVIVSTAHSGFNIFKTISV